MSFQHPRRGFFRVFNFSTRVLKFSRNCVFCLLRRYIGAFCIFEISSFANISLFIDHARCTLTYISLSYLRVTFYALESNQRAVNANISQNPYQSLCAEFTPHRGQKSPDRFSSLSGLFIVMPLSSKRR